MSIYKLMNSNRGKRYTKDGKLTSVSKISQEIIEKLEVDPMYNDGIMEPSKKCIFCGKTTELSRFLNMRTIAVCEEHLDNKTTGQIVQQYNSLQGVSDEGDVQTQEAEKES